MYCSKCGNFVPDGMKFCNKCGKPMGEVPVGNPGDNQSINSNGDNHKKDKSRDGVKIALIVLIIIGLLAIVGVGAFAVKEFILDDKVSSQDDKDDKDKKSKKHKDDDEDEAEKEIDAEDVDDEDADHDADNDDAQIATSDDSANASAEAKVDLEEAEVGIHTYSFFIEDISWYEALEKSREKGGYLVRINSQDEWYYIMEQMMNLGYYQDVFYIGGKRDDDSSEYHWIGNDGELYNTTLNSQDAWCYDLWMANEPSYNDTDGTVENCMMIFYREKDQRYVWNDSTAYVNDLNVYTGKLGYIVEYE